MLTLREHVVTVYTTSLKTWNYMQNEYFAAKVSEGCYGTFRDIISAAFSVLGSAVGSNRVAVIMKGTRTENSACQ